MARNANNRARGATSQKIWEMVVYAMLAALMLISKLVMEALPNVHLLGVLTVVYTVVFRGRALIPIYLYVFMNGVIAGFSFWWVPYLYIWTLLWGAVMLVPERLPRGVRAVVYPIICSIHGFLFGVLYAPAQALAFGLDFRGMLAWIAAGSVFDIIHGVSNLVLGLLALPLSELIVRLAGDRLPSRKKTERRIDKSVSL